MAKPKSPAKPAKPAQPARTEGDSSITPAPGLSLQATLTTLHKESLLHRVHQDKFQASQFNPGILGNARFSPIHDASGKPIPTLYAGSTMECALMETVFHDVPHTSGFKTFAKEKLEGQVHSIVQVAQDLSLIDLASVPLRKLGITRKQLIDTEKDQYPATREWAKALHGQYPEAQGMTWVSRQDDSARAVVVFGDRIPNDALQPVGDSRSLLEDLAAYDTVIDLAERIGVNIVPGKS